MFKIYETYRGSTFEVWSSEYGIKDGLDPDAAALDTARYLRILESNAKYRPEPVKFVMVYEPVDG